MNLSNIPINRCKCNISDDIRSGDTCHIARVCQTGDDLTTPCNCSSDFHNSECECNTNFHPSGCRCFIKKDRDYPLDFGLACMNNIPICQFSIIQLYLTSDEKNKTINTFLEHLNNYAFIDTSLNPTGTPIGYGKHAVNILGYLDLINTSIYTNTFDFLEDILVLLNNLKDPHTIFNPPCVSKQTAKNTRKCRSTKYTQTVFIQSSLYTLVQSQSDEVCTSSSIQPEPNNSCTCTGTIHSLVCQCPFNSQQLTDIPSEQCKSLDGDDPRAETICPFTEECEELILDPTDRGCFYIANYKPDFCNKTPISCSCADNGPIQTQECKCSQLHHPDGCKPVKYFVKYQEFSCLCTQEHLKDTDECICPSNDLVSLHCVCSTTLEYNPQDCTIKDCLANSDTTVTKYSYWCTKDNHPAKYRCPSLPKDLQGIPVEQCQCLADNDPREGGACPITRLCQIDDDLSTHYLCSEDFHQDNCICTSIYHPSTLVCKSITNPSFDIKTRDESLRFEKLSTCDEETGYEGGDYCEDEKYSAIDYCHESDSPSIYPQSCICIDGNSPEGCVCTLDSKDLIGVPVAQCECRSTGDPRSGLTTPGAGCLEFQSEADKAYPFLINCNGVHESQLKSNTCKCIDGYTPTGCTCLRDTDLNQLDGESPGQCKCLDEDDPRVGISCPISRKCSREDLQSTPCLCSTNFNQSR
ncbi:MAG: hypothetical protein EZS28_020181 [Streblomastix strix]|uniref:Uncharacterized protein n=1 Tax=Streblomastix strix TaxID=222440 RepID=A0A5J4VP29_9EUKA|nr:MAG: hypothetical protein EZS28_020181 [Streblomastix strix]